MVVLIVGIGYETHWYGLSPATKSAPGACPTGITITGAGANFLTALMSNWETGFNTATQDKVSYNPSGAGAGITSFTSNEVNFAATDEPLTVAQYGALPGTTLTLPVTGGAVAVIYNLPGFTGPLHLTGAQLAGIYLGTITNWNSTALASDNHNLPNATIIPVVRSDGAGTTYVLTNYLSDDNTTFNTTVGISIQPTWPTIAAEVEEHGNSALATYVASTAGKDSVGYVDLADAIAHDNGSIAGMGNPHGDFVVPTVTNTQSAIDYMAAHQTFPNATANWAGVTFVNSPQAGDYPLATLSYFLVLQNPAKGNAGLIDKSVAYTQVIVAFLQWSITSGQPMAAGLEYNVPPAALLTQDTSAIQTINYNGTSLPACSI